MGNATLEAKVVQIISWGALIATLIVTDRISYEPANLGKMAVLTVSAFAGLFISLTNTKVMWKRNKIATSFLVIFVLASLTSIILSETLFIRGFYGTIGRSTGFLTYLGLALLFFLSMSFLRKESLSRVITFFYIAGISNIVYCIAASLGFDIITWDNTYNKVLGTFGNPNFIASFMGIFFCVNLAYFQFFKQSRKRLVTFFVIAISSLYVVYESGSLQGYVLIAYGLFMITFFYLHFSLSSNLVSRAFLMFSIVLGFIAIAGVLQKGPLASILYKPSVTFRGEYWQAGLNMAKDNVFFGIGLDSYGLFYRQYRDASAAIYPGLGVVTDAAHNVFIDVFAGAGLFALVAYLGIFFLVSFRSLKYFNKLDKFDPIFTALFLGWSSYQIQSIISINQIGLAVWGWLFGGCLIAYTASNKASQVNDLKMAQKIIKSRNPQEKELLPPIHVLLLVLGVGIGIGVSSPSFYADVKFRQAISVNKTTIEKVLGESERWPQDNFRMERIVVALANQNYGEEAQFVAAKYALLFPNDFAAWKALWSLSPEGSKEQQAYKVKLHELDPLSPEWK